MLRFHLILESLLSLYLDEKCHGEVGNYAKPLRDFSQRLGMAAALGIPIQIATVIHLANNMRNKPARARQRGCEATRETCMFNVYRRPLTQTLGETSHRTPGETPP